MLKQARLGSDLFAFRFALQANQRVQLDKSASWQAPQKKCE
jgi:hypothetical protein